MKPDKLNFGFYSHKDSRDLGILRITFYSLLLIVFWNEGFSDLSLAELPLWEPHLLFRWLGLGLVELETIRVLSACWKFSLFGAAIGLLTPIFTISSFVLGFYLMGLEAGFIDSNFYYQLVVISMATMALASFAPGLWTFSLDRIIFRLNNKLNQNRFNAWPFRLIICCTCLMFFSAAISKLRESGVEWVVSNQFLIILKNVNYLVDNANPWVIQANLWLRGQQLLTLILGCIVVVVELLFPLAFLYKRLQLPFLIIGIGFSLGVWVFMYISAQKFLICLIPFWLTPPIYRFLRQNLIRFSIICQSCARQVFLDKSVNSRFT